MAVVNTKATAISNADQLFPKVNSNSALGKSAVFAGVGTVAVASGDSNGSVYRFVRVPSGARIHRLDITSDAMAGFVSAFIGVYRAQDTSGTDGAVVSSTLFGAGVDLTAQQTEPYDVIFNNLGITNIEKRIWELLGLTADPQIFYDICVTASNKDGASGNLSMAVEWVI